MTKPRTTSGTILNENHAGYEYSRPHERQSDRAGPILARNILAGPHELVLSEFLLNETARVLRYPRMHKLYKLTSEDIAEHIQLLRTRADIVSPIIYESVVLADPDDDPVVYTAVAGQADVLCAVDRDFYAADLVSFCQQRGIAIMNDVALLRKLRTRPLE